MYYGDCDGRKKEKRERGGFDQRLECFKEAAANERAAGVRAVKTEGKAQGDERLGSAKKVTRET